MWTPNLFINEKGRVRSGWRLSIFVVLFLCLSVAFYLALRLVLHVALLRSSYSAERLLDTAFGFVAQGGIMLAAATLAGWLCGSWLEDVPLRALGWTTQSRWLRDLLLGLLLGALSLLVAACVSVLTGGLRFSAATGAASLAVVKTLGYSAVVFAISAAGEEALFRGYSLQTLLRSIPFWAAVIPSSVFFAGLHLGNPHVAPAFTFVNTILAGIWLAVGYLRTRNLWFPFGLHFAWNWTMGALLGLPVSGITSITPAPLLRAVESGPAWLTGGSYGPEGGAACTLALIISTLFIWRTHLLAAEPELKRFTDEEIPDQPVEIIPLRPSDSDD